MFCVWKTSIPTCLRAQLAAARGDDAERAPEGRPPFLSFQLMRARILVRDRTLTGAPSVTRLLEPFEPGEA
jgi:hypothetical protein